MAGVWTHGRWTVREGHEDEFVAAWLELARSALAEFDPPAPPTLLRDRERPNVFLSFGPWDSAETVDRFRASDVFRRSFETIQPLLESFETFTLDEADPGD